MDWVDRIGRRLSPHDLHVFVAVVEDENMALAAKRLAISRPVVSRTIAGLEHTLGVSLFDRTSKGVTPTQFGQALFERSLAIFDELKKSVQEIQTLSDPNSGELTFGCIETLMAGLGSVAIDTFLRQYPNVSIDSMVGNPATLIEFLNKRRCELIAIRGSSSIAPHLIDQEILFHERMFVVVSKNSKFAKRRKISLSDLHREQWILAKNAIEVSAPLSEAYSNIGLGMPNVSIFSQSHWLRFVLLQNSDFITMFPESVLKFGNQYDFIKVLPIEIPRWKQPIIVATLKGRSLTPVAKNFIEILKDLSSPLR